MAWEPASIEEVRAIVEEDLKDCDTEQIAVYRKYAVEPYLESIERSGKMESVVVVARKEDEVIYWEDIEEGFNVSPVAADGRILEHWCNQDALKFALNAWVEGRGISSRAGPVRPLE